jgi:acetyl-CoA carboxylase carboxyl transferase subunit beta
MSDITVEITHKTPNGSAGPPEQVLGPAPMGASGGPPAAGLASPPTGSQPGGGSVCGSCARPVQDAVLTAALQVCPLCGYHNPVGAFERVAQLADPHSWRQVAAQLRPDDPLSFFDLRPYPERLREAQQETGLSDAFLAGRCTIAHRRVALGVLDFRFMGGSMGSVVGEVFARLVARAVEDHVPLVTVVASGGARMQEGILSLMQMAKTVVALEILADAGLPHISVLTHPTTGGVLASFATAADVIIAEPGAFLTFTGPRVIEQTTREKLPPGFGSAESNFAHGQLDMIVPRAQLKHRLALILRLLQGGDEDGPEPVQPDQTHISWGGGAFARAFAGAKKLALAPRSWLFGGDSDT